MVRINEDTLRLLKMEKAMLNKKSYDEVIDEFLGKKNERKKTQSIFPKW